jgi:predicted DNA-binding transcriptional regulator AlpA
MPPRLWTVKETAEFLGIPVSTLYYWSYRGEGGPRILRIGRSLRYNPIEVEAWSRSDGA